MLFSVPGQGDQVDVDLSSVKVLLDGRAVPAEATIASESGRTVRRTAVLAIDTSRSMNGERFTEAKRAASVFLDSVPDDVYVGVVTFAGRVEVVQEPTLDRSATRTMLDGLTLALGTRLYEGVREAVRATGATGQRRVLVLSDGRDTSRTPVSETTSLIDESEVRVDVVALEQTAAARRPLAQVATAGDGQVLQAGDPAALSTAFSREADELARQILVTADVPDDQASSEAQLQVAITAADERHSDSAFVTIKATTAQNETVARTAPAAVPAPRFAVTRDQMLGGIAALGVGTLLVTLTALGVLTPTRRRISVEDRVAAFSRDGGEPGRGPGPAAPGHFIAAPPMPAPNLSGQAVGMAQKALAQNRGVEVSIGGRLEGAGLALKPAEWLLAHAGISFGAGLLGFLLSSGGALLTVLFLALGAVLPWVYLGLKRSRRLKRFNGQLADTLQLMAGSLSAGLSLAQSLDTVEREGSEPIAGEFRRALVETRLGVSIEDALESVAERMQSKDFNWVVMAIRIQREVGGNLSELLLTVAGTLREREYLRRQVSALSAEGRLSCWILGGLPPGFMLYLLMVRRDYVAPLFSTPIGLMMCVVMGLLLVGGVFWMSRLVKVEV